MTTNGPFSGVEENGVLVFKGIRFGRAPVGERRWRPPVPPEYVRTVRRADSYGPRPPQAIGTCEDRANESEDCLFLNVWSPLKRDDRRLPVIVRFFGGGFRNGDASARRNDLSGWARRGVLAVEANYRLGRLGWFGHPELTAEARAEGTGIANLGLMDQIAVLRWVRDNIGAFGGDPARVTICGSSSGAISVNMLMLSPPARGLFAGAVTNSGFGRESEVPLERAEAEGVALASRLGANDLRSLRAVPVERIIAESEGLKGPVPIVDGTFVLSTVFEGFERSREMGIPWIVGSNGDDASRIADAFPNPSDVFAKLPDGLRDRVVAAFAPVDDAGSERAARRFLTARVLTEPARALARLHARKAPTWRYVFDYVPTGLRRLRSAAVHGEENAFLLDNFSAVVGDEAYVPSSEDRSTADAFVELVFRFAATGDPNDAGATTWPDQGDDRVLLIDAAGFRCVPHDQAAALDVVEALARAQRL